jgi:hypothetical protein
VPMAESIRRFWAGSLGDSFFRNLPLVYDSRPAGNGTISALFRPYKAAFRQRCRRNQARASALTAKL